MDRADIVPVSLRHPDPIKKKYNPGMSNIALGVAFTCVRLEAPAFDFTQAVMLAPSRPHSRMVGALSICPTLCGIFFELTPIEDVYVTLEVAARKAQVKIIWHPVLTEDGFWNALAAEPQLEALRSLVLDQPV